MIRIPFLAPIAPAFALAFALSLPGAAGAASIDAARAAHAEGRFTDAAKLAEALGTSAGYALAAEAMTIRAYYLAADGAKEGLLERALRLAQKAVEKNPGNPDGHLMVARAAGRLTQTIGTFEAADRGFVETIRSAIESEMKLDPGRASAYLGMAMWHAEVVNAAGSFIARLTYGARESSALANFEQALKRAPDEKVVLYEYALGLLLLDDDEYQEKARALLKRAVEAPAKHAFDRILQRRAKQRLKRLASGG